MTTCAQYTTMLGEAQTALHKLIIGSKVEVLRDGEKAMTYSKAEIAQLRAYVADLQAKVNDCNGVASGRRRIIHFIPE